MSLGVISADQWTNAPFASDQRSAAQPSCVPSPCCVCSISLCLLYDFVGKGEGGAGPWKGAAGGPGATVQADAHVRALQQQLVEAEAVAATPTSKLQAAADEYTKLAEQLNSSHAEAAAIMAKLQEEAAAASAAEAAARVSVLRYQALISKISHNDRHKHLRTSQGSVCASLACQHNFTNQTMKAMGVCLYNPTHCL